MVTKKQAKADVKEALQSREGVEVFIAKYLKGGLLSQGALGELLLHVAQTEAPPPWLDGKAMLAAVLLARHDGFEEARRLAVEHTTQAASVLGDSMPASAALRMTADNIKALKPGMK